MVALSFDLGSAHTRPEPAQFARVSCRYFNSLDQLARGPTLDGRLRKLVQDSQDQIKGAPERKAEGAPKWEDS